VLVQIHLSLSLSKYPVGWYFLNGNARLLFLGT
jgi:hypothetical protein